SDFVEDGFTRQWIQLRNEVKSRGVPQEPRLDLVCRVHALPSHRHTELRHAHEFLREWHMAREKDPNSRLASGFENLKHLSVICWPFSICFTIPTCMSYTTKANRARPHGLLVAAGCT